MIQSTKAIVLRSVKYGETSVILTALTEKFGLQSYIIRGARQGGKSGKSQFLQAGALLEMEVYHRDSGNLKQVKSVGWHRIYLHLFTDILKNGMLMFMVELLQKSITEQEENADLFSFCEESFKWLDETNEKDISLFPSYFCIHLSHFFGFRIPEPGSNLRDHEIMFLNLQDGVFTNLEPQHEYYLEGKNANSIAELLKVLHPDDLVHAEIDRASRGEILDALLLYYRLHLPNFGEMRSLPILRMVLR